MHTMLKGYVLGSTIQDYKQLNFLYNLNGFGTAITIKPVKKLLVNL